MHISSPSEGEGERAPGVVFRGSPEGWPLVVAATRLEARAVRRALPEARVALTGVGLRWLPDGGVSLTGAVVTCGVAGSLRSDLPTGTVLVPRLVVRPDGSTLACDAALVEALAEGSRRLGLEPELGPMLTAAELVVGAERRAQAATGCGAVDMETGLLRAERVASVRVVLDTPERELHAAWRRPVSVLWRPAAWAQLPWLAAEGPRCARLAAQVLATALSGAGR